MKVKILLFCLYFSTITYLTAEPTNNDVLHFTILNDLNNSWTLWDDCDSHLWQHENWGGSMTRERGSFHGRNCLKITISEDWGVLRTDAFYNENWNSPLQGLAMDIYYETDEPGARVKLQVYNSNLSMIEPEIISASNLSYQQWQEYTWSFNTASNYSKTSKLQFIFDNFGTEHSPYTFYLDNIRLISNNIFVPWDDLDDTAHEWTYSWDSDALHWNSSITWIEELEPVTHNRTSFSNPAGAVFMPFASGKSPNSYAKVSADNLNNGSGEDWSAYTVISAQVFCSGTNRINVGFWDSHANNGIETAEKKVSQINTWQTLEWDLPSGSFNWASVDAVYFVVKTDQVVTGTIYIDHIRRGY